MSLVALPKLSFGLDHVAIGEGFYCIFRTFSISFRLRLSTFHSTPSCFTLAFYHRASPHLPTLAFHALAVAYITTIQ